MCPHGGQITAITSNMRTNAMGDPILTSSDTFTVAGCPFIIGTMPHPCIQVKWIVSAMRVKVSSNQALTMQSVGLCIAADQAPQGSVIMAYTQVRASGQ
jgi:hypothetical protein